jgi:hypothetical protein
MKNFTPLVTLSACALLLVVFSGYNFISAFSPWAPPTALPPGNNTDTPINLGSSYQVKSGDIGAIVLRSGETWSGKYCDITGVNCFTPGNLLPTCAVGDTLVAGANGTWSCSSGSVGGGVKLFGSQHSPGQCTSLGGTVTSDGAGNDFCRFTNTNPLTTYTANPGNVSPFSVALCPAGWAHFQNWGAWGDKSLSDPCGNTNFVRVSPISWGNVSPFRSIWCGSNSGTNHSSNQLVSGAPTELGCY